VAADGARRACGQQLAARESSTGNGTLEGILEANASVCVFGEPFRTGHGLHNIHQNQGDPLGSQWAAENGIWQDGGTIVERADGSLLAFISKFRSQSYATDDEAHPEP
jgi:uncharacterized protein YukJ